MFGGGDARGGPGLEEGRDAGETGVKVAPSAMRGDLRRGLENIMGGGVARTVSNAFAKSL